MTITAPASSNALDDIEVPGRTSKEKSFDVLLWGTLLVMLVWSFVPSGMHRVWEIATQGDNIYLMVKDFLEPNFRYWHSYLDLMLESVQMAVWGTVLSVLLGVPFGLLSSTNIAPAWVVFPVRRLMDAFRAINELVFALIFVAAVGLGPLAGVLALAIHTTGVLAKLMSEAVEAIDPRPVEGVRATGASRLQEIVYAVIPQVLPLWISLSLYRFESNVRSATVLGIVGAGGIGMSLSEALRGFEYASGAAILLIILATVSIFDIFGSLLRKVVIDGEDHMRFAAYLAFLTVLIVLIELILAGTFDGAAG
ncbi:MAG: phosphonate ABC transporter, permease protein PhnE [Pseudomonadota bacterium]